MISASVLPRSQNTYVQAIHALKSDEAERYVFAFSYLSRGELDLLGTVGTLDVLKSNRRPVDEQPNVSWCLPRVIRGGLERERFDAHGLVELLRHVVSESMR
jgi:hypothetical protein